MANGDLQAGFLNNRNLVSLREGGSSVKRYTDQAIDLDGDGTKEMVTFTTVPLGGKKFRHVVTKPDGIARSIVVRIIEKDGGIAATPDVFTEGS